MEQVIARPLILWNGFPACGLLLKKLLKAYPGTPVFATRPRVPFENLENLLGQKILGKQNSMSHQALFFFTHTFGNFALNLYKV